MHSLWVTHLDSQDQPSLQLGGSILQPTIGFLDLWTSCEQVTYLQETHDLDLLYKY